MHPRLAPPPRQRGGPPHRWCHHGRSSQYEHLECKKTIKLKNKQPLLLYNVFFENQHRSLYRHVYQACHAYPPKPSQLTRKPEKPTFLALCQCFFVNKIPCILGEWGMNRDEVSTRVQLIQAHGLNTVTPCSCGWQDRVISHGTHAKCLAPVGNLNFKQKRQTILWSRSRGRKEHMTKISATVLGCSQRRGRNSNGMRLQKLFSK